MGDESLYFAIFELLPIEYISARDLMKYIPAENQH